MDRMGVITITLASVGEVRKNVHSTIQRAEKAKAEAETAFTDALAIMSFLDIFAEPLKAELQKLQKEAQEKQGD